jgi:uncharacterized C2H2 Zn-finger protein
MADRFISIDLSHLDPYFDNSNPVTQPHNPCLSRNDNTFAPFLATQSYDFPSAPHVPPYPEGSVIQFGDEKLDNLTPLNTTTDKAYATYGYVSRHDQAEYLRGSDYPPQFNQGSQHDGVLLHGIHGSLPLQMNSESPQDSTYTTEDNMPDLSHSYTSEPYVSSRSEVPSIKAEQGRWETKEQLKSCLQCGALCQDQRDLVRHECSHFRNKQFQCPFPRCMTTLARRDNYRRHLRVFHGSTLNFTAKMTPSVQDIRSTQSNSITTTGSEMTTPSDGQAITSALKPAGVTAHFDKATGTKEIQNRQNIPPPPPGKPGLPMKTQQNASRNIVLPGGEDLTTNTIASDRAAASPQTLQLIDPSGSARIAQRDKAPITEPKTMPLNSSYPSDVQSSCPTRTATSHTKFSEKMASTAPTSISSNPRAVKGQLSVLADQAPENQEVSTHRYSTVSPSLFSL